MYFELLLCKSLFYIKISLQKSCKDSYNWSRCQFKSCNTVFLFMELPIPSVSTEGIGITISKWNEIQKQNKIFALRLQFQGAQVTSENIYESSRPFRKMSRKLKKFENFKRFSLLQNTFLGINLIKINLKLVKNFNFLSFLQFN